MKKQYKDLFLTKSVKLSVPFYMTLNEISFCPKIRFFFEQAIQH